MPSAKQVLPLTKAARIHLIAPSYPLKPEEVAAAVALVEGMGFQPVVTENLLGEDLLSAHQDVIRLQHVKAAFQDDTAEAVWALRGGYGATRLMPELLAMQPPARPKWLIGFSDITALHLLVGQHWGWQSIHAPVLVQMVTGRVDVESIAAIQALLTDGSYRLPAMRPMNAAAEAAAPPVEADRLVGGNLSLLAASLGTAWQVRAEGAWLFFEEVDERGYRIDRMLTQMHQAGVFQSVRGVLVGDCSGGAEADGSSKVGAVLERFLGALPLPAFRLAGVGHERRNLPLRLRF